MLVLPLKDLCGQSKRKAFIFAAENRIYGDEKFANELQFSEQVVKILEESNKSTIKDELIFHRNDRWELF